VRIGPRRARRLRATAVAAVLTTGCAARPIAVPTGPGAPFSAIREAYAEATARCRGVRTWSAEIRLSGRSGETTLRGRVIAGLAPGALRLEGVAPFGQPIFVLVARDEAATLLLPRDRRVLDGEPPGAIVEALTGVALGPDALRALVSGCLSADGEPRAGRAYGGGWVAADLPSGTTAYLRRADGRWRLEAGSLTDLLVEYRNFGPVGPGRVRVTSPHDRSGARVDLTLTIDQVDINVELPDEAFRVIVAEGVAPMTLEALREAGPLGVKR